MIVTVDEMKDHLRILEDDEDDYLEGLILKSQKAAEDFCFTEWEDDEAPEPVRLAVMLMTSHYFENRDNHEKLVWETMRRTFENLLYPYRDYSKLF